MKKILNFVLSAIVLVVLLFNFALPAMATETDSSPVCLAGGCHSTSCTVTVEVSVLDSGGSGSISVSCEPGYYACCTASAFCFSGTRCTR